MRRLRGRRLHPEPGQVGGGCDADDCWAPPPPLFLRLAPGPAPAPPPSFRALPEPCPPPSAPSPAPVRAAGGGRRDQGRPHGYGSPPGGGSGSGADNKHHRMVVTSALATVAAIAFVSLILLGVSLVVRRRQMRRRRQALLAAPAAPGPAAPTDFDDPEFGGGGVVHHVWYIRTVGLDEAAIESIAATRYREGAGLLGAADCTVCLGEFQDGELVRLLPKCGHAFHVPCIDTWLRAHVNCPLCRSDVLDPAVATETGGGGESSTTPPVDPVDEDDNSADVEQEDDATSEAMSEHGQEGNGHQPEPETSPAVEDHQHEQPSFPEQPPPQFPCPLPHNVRRAASMDAAIVSTAVEVAAALERLPEAAPEEEQSGRRKRGTTGSSFAKASGSGHRSSLSTDRAAPGGIPRSFFSRQCRARSSVSPL